MLPVVRRERQIDCLGAQHKTGARKSSRVLNNALNIIWTAPDSAQRPPGPGILQPRPTRCKTKVPRNSDTGRGEKKNGSDGEL